MPACAPPASAAARRLPVLCAGSLVGAASQLQQAVLWPAAAYAAVLLLAAAVAWPGRRRALAWFVVAAGAAFALAGLRAAAFQQDTLSPVLEGRDVVVVARVAAMPHTTESGTRLRLAVELAELDGQPVRLPPTVNAGWYAPWPGSDAAGPQPVRAGERWRLALRLKAPHGHRNPHGFDYELWLWEQGVQATASVRASPAPQRMGDTAWHPVERARQTVRDAILQRLRDTPRAAGVVAALVTGDQRAIDRADWDVFRATGVAHLVSISGIHITLFAWLAAACVAAGWRRSGRLSLALPAQTAALWGGVALAGAYALFAGWGVPAQRTVLMLALFAGLRSAGVRWPWPRAWLLAAAVAVAVDPWALLAPGFWLSFVAVGVLFAGGSATEIIAPQQGRTMATGRFGIKTRALAREQLVVTAALAPLTLLLFGQVSVVGLVANLLAIPWVTLVVTPLALLGMLLPPLWDAAAACVEAMAWALGWLARWPWATFSVAQPPLWAGAAGLAGGLLLVARLPPGLRLLGLPLLLPVLLWQAPRPPPGHFDVLAADVGQGSAVLVRTARHALLYDAGPRFSRDSDAGHRVVVPLLRALDVRLDRVLLSHRDSDHAGGAAAVMAAQPQALLQATLEPGHPLRPAVPCEAGAHWEWDGVRFAVLHPPAGSVQGAGAGNAESCVLHIEAAAGGGRALLPGDIGAAQEEALARMHGAALAADFLLVPHHGSKTSSSAALLAAVDPAVAVAQAGWRNRFGHPAPAIVARYAERGVLFADSARCGAAGWHSMRPREMVCERAHHPRYWQHRP